MINLNKNFIIANPKGGAWEMAVDIHERLTKLAEERKFPVSFYLNKLVMEEFRVGEILPHISDNVRRSNCFYMSDSSQRPNDWFTETALVNYALKFASADEIINVHPNLFYSRQDSKDEPRIPISAKVVANMISRDADRVITVDAHFKQIQGYYNVPLESLPSFRTVADYLNKHHPEILLDEELIIASPDAGGGKRVEGFARRINKNNIAIGHKVRNETNGKGETSVEKLEFPREVVENRNIFLYDDIGDSFGTLETAINVLHNYGAKKIYAYSTHAYFTRGYESITGLEKLFIGNTIKQPFVSGTEIPNYARDKIETISFAPILAEAIYRTSIGDSISELFN